MEAVDAIEFESDQKKSSFEQAPEAKAGPTPEEALASIVRTALAEVRDPEIQPVSIVDLGLVERVAVTEVGVEIDLLPTFAGCPALDVIRQDVEAAARAVAPDHDVRVRFVYSPPWTSDRISPSGREAMRGYGLTPPPAVAAAVFVPLASLSRVEGVTECPFCASRDTVLESAFGPTLCRATHFCRSCHNPFEAFKPKIA